MSHKTFIGILFAGMALVIGVSFYADFRNPFSSREVPGFDGRLRLNEAEVLRKGINPFDILSGNIYPPEGYIAGNHEVNARWEVPPSGNKEVHTYTPWSYSLVLPFTFIDRTLAGRLFWLIDTAALLFVFGFAFFAGYRIRSRWPDGAFVAAAAICLGNPFPVNSNLNNYSTILVAAVIGMCWCLNKKRDILAGFLWALILIKPHFGVLFGIPILMQRRWKTLLTAPVVCIVASIPASLLCRTNPMQMCLNVIDKTGAGFCFKFTGFFPAPVFNMLSNLVGSSVVLFFSVAMGVSLMLLLLWKLRKCKDFFLLSLPVAITIPMWLYSQYQDAAILCLLQMALAVAIINQCNRQSRVSFVMAMLGILLFLNASRIFISVMVVARYFGFYDVIRPICLSAFHICKLLAYLGCVAFIMYILGLLPDNSNLKAKR